MQELSLNILDIVQNSVKAKASLIEIIIDENIVRDRMIIEIIDNGCGMTKEQVKNVEDPFFTTRTTRKVGLGVSLFKMAAEMTGGSFHIESEVNIGTKVHAEFVYSHIDRMPLGDIGSTITTLIQCNENIDFLYLHKLNEKSFILDTREFREILEGIPLSSPEVMSFIKNYLIENYNELYENLKKGEDNYEILS